MIDKIKEFFVKMFLGKESSLYKSWETIRLKAQGYKTYMLQGAFLFNGFHGLTNMIADKDLAWVITNAGDLASSPAGIAVQIGLGLITIKAGQDRLEKSQKEDS
jgi:hypothetical protein